MLSALLEMQPRAPGTASDSLGAGLRALTPLIHPGSLVLTLSDYASLDAGSDAQWVGGLAVHNEFRLFWVTDPLERQALPNGRFRIGIPGRSVSVDGGAIRDAWVEKWRARETRIEQLARNINASVTQLDTSEPVEDVLRTLLSGRRTAA